MWAGDSFTEVWLPGCRYPFTLYFKAGEWLSGFLAEIYLLPAECGTVSNKITNTYRTETGWFGGNWIF